MVIVIGNSAGTKYYDIIYYHVAMALKTNSDIILCSNANYLYRLELATASL